MQNKSITKWFSGLVAIALVLTIHLSLPTENLTNRFIVNKTNQTVKKLPRLERKKARAEREFFMTRDPKLNRIPQLAKIHELEWEKKSQNFKSTSDLFNWEVAGPYDVGGRTRGFQIDVRSAPTIVAAGVSGGIWKSTNGASTWSLKTPQYQNLNVTWLAQDPRDGHQDTWYAVTGEFDGNSAGSPGSGFRGYGILKSTDNAESWQILESSINPDITSWNSEFDYMNKVDVNPINGDVYVSSHAGVLLKSTNGGDSWDFVLGDFGAFQYVDFEIASTGRIVAILSDDGYDDNPEFPNAGIYYSDDNGSNWNDVTPSDISASHYRTKLALAPSNENSLYALLFRGGSSYQFYKINLANGTFENRTDNMPNFGGLAGDYNAQGGYNMVLEVKPNDEDFVVMGGTNLYRSTDGFATHPIARVGVDTTQTDRNDHWVGGYTNSNTSYGLYPNHHPDQHFFQWDPNPLNPLAGAYSAHDGGISKTSDFSASTVSWSNNNAGYYVTQFYHGSISRIDGNEQVIGGTQDNGTPFFNVGDEDSQDISSGDGSYSFFGKSKIYASSQSGNALRYDNNNGTFSFAGYINPEDNINGNDFMFIHPFEVDKNNENVVYFPDGDGLYRSTTGGNTWEDLRNTLKARNGATITTLEVSVSPANVLYFGASDRRRRTTYQPYIYKLVDANTSTTAALELELPNSEVGAYVSDIAIHPTDANNVLVTLSNYNIEGIYHTANGQDFVAVEGNLIGDESTPGPSIRSAAIVEFEGRTHYVVGTTTGIYRTEVLDGNNTIWIKEGNSAIGNAIVNTLSIRETDNHIMAATHGRGVYYGTPNSAVSNEETNLVASSFKLKQNYPNPFNPTTTIDFQLASVSEVTLEVYNVLGQRVASLLNNASKNVGTHSIVFDATNLSSGTYIYRLTFSDNNGNAKVLSKKMLLIK